MLRTSPSIVAIALAALFILPSDTNGAPIKVSGTFAQPYWGVPSGTITEVGLPFATDGDMATGYVVTVGPGTINQSQGFFVRWDFDISRFLSITSFTFTFDGILSDPSPIDSLRIGASPSSKFVTLDGPDGTRVGMTLTLTPGAAEEAYDLANYIFKRKRLSVYVGTNFGTGPAYLGTVALSTLEISADITGVTKPVPEPDSLLLLGTAAGGTTFAAWRRRKHSV